MTNTKLIITTLAAVPFVCAVGVFAGIASADRSANDYSAENQRKYAEMKKAQEEREARELTAADWPSFTAPAKRNFEADAVIKHDCGWWFGGDNSPVGVIKAGIYAESSRANVSSYFYKRIKSMNEWNADLRNKLGPKVTKGYDQYNVELVLGVIETTYDLIKSGSYKNNESQTLNYMYQLCEKRVYDAVKENGGSAKGLKFYTKAGTM